eukprot:TRINITY_DN10247_c0_g1_i1.p1 TRINITY_DN10247_c0_g1~~TRINITY_DN10247_c0_g1_i1.p1  ORF type:complete len:332 (-),score=79.10 TRINITY_DN10247_c0_g1_i1:18-1013(-)
MMKNVLILALIICSVFASQDEKELKKQFNDFMIKYNKRYDNDEISMRFDNFKASVARVEQQNKNSNGATYGITKFSDMSTEEFKTIILMTKETQKVSYLDDLSNEWTFDSSLPSSLDWRDQNVVTPIKNQGQCGSCWAFSATEAIESANIIAGKASVDSINLSPQQIVDCDHDIVFGCFGGRTSGAYEYIKKVKGQEGIDHYPYTGRTEFCHFNASYINASITDYTSDLGKNETNLQTNLVGLGPLSICLDAEHWQEYTGGILTAHECCPLGICELDHCVQLVGYNATDPANSYWIVRNSWGTDWGLDGYIQLQMGKNACGITKDVTWPTV